MSGDRLKLEVREREELGSRRSRRLRAQGLIPGVLYGNGHSRAIVVPERALRAAMTGPSGLHAILDVVIEGQKTVHPSILAEYEQDPIRGTISHIDLREVRLDQPIHATVIVHLVGESVGVKSGGVLSLVGRELQVEALPADVPEHIDVDISALEVGDVLRLAEIPEIGGVTFLDDPHETVIATVSMPRGYAEIEEADL
ncbi:MAG TPA: 50S ribosomal protein L25, partial [Gaiellaceae bacterium]|nr:50S ribosomal protein L25 [Gaiellaceae bacterium]